MAKIAVIPGDGIGREVIQEAYKVLETIRDTGIELGWDEFDYCAEKYLQTGITLPEKEIENFRDNYDAILIGALGDPRVPDMKHEVDILLGCRFKLDLFINWLPVRLLHEKLCPIKNKSPEDVNFVVFRENTEGVYTGTGGYLKKGTTDEVAIQTSINTYKGVERIIRHAFEYAREHHLPTITMSNKSNTMRYEGDLWDRVFKQINDEYPEIQGNHLYIEILLMEMVSKPEQFDVIVTCNMLGDIVTHMGAQLIGGKGLAGVANVNPGKVSLFQPICDPAPKSVGKDIANPIAAILTVGIMMQHLGYPEWVTRIEKAVVRAFREKNVTRDIGGNLGTQATGSVICRYLRDQV